MRSLLGVDGCGLPVHGVPLRAIATLYARLGVPERLPELESEAARATGAMVAEPYLVAGRDRFETALMQAAQGVLAKDGAEALCCVSLPHLGLGVALKVSDAGFRAVASAMMAVLDQLDAIEAAPRAALDAYAHPVVYGGGQPVGHLEPLVTLRRR